MSFFHKTCKKNSTKKYLILLHHTSFSVAFSVTFFYILLTKLGLHKFFGFFC